MNATTFDQSISASELGDVIAKTGEVLHSDPISSQRGCCELHTDILVVLHANGNVIQATNTMWGIEAHGSSDPERRQKFTTVRSRIPAIPLRIAVPVENVVDERNTIDRTGALTFLPGWATLTKDSIPGAFVIPTNPNGLVQLMSVIEAMKWLRLP